jgi:hypothetical protein
LPSVEKLYESLKNRPDVVVLTMNVDEEPDKARAYVQKEGFQFPVLLAFTFVRKQLETKGIPRNWVFDGNLVFRTDEIGFHARGWLPAMTANVEKALKP